MQSKSKPKSTKGKDTKSRLTAKLEQLREEREPSKEVANEEGEMGFDEGQFRVDRGIPQLIYII